MDKTIQIPAKVAFAIFKQSLFGKLVSLASILQKETNDTYYYVNSKYVCHGFYPDEYKKDK